MRSLVDVRSCPHVSELGTCHSRVDTRRSVSIVKPRIITHTHTRGNRVHSTCSRGGEREKLPWEVLGVRPVASEKEIKKAHRKLVLEHHPDRHIGHDDPNKRTIQKRFMKIQEAYEMLMGRRHGNVLGEKVEQDGWNFHDFFWSFNYHRRKREERMGVAGTPPPPAGAWKGQMENLKRRAALRQWKKQSKEQSEGRTSASSNIMNGTNFGKAEHAVDVGGESKSAHHVNSQLAGLKRRADLKKTILDDNV